ncbi:hypothetical protein L1987_63068 [Smallanthus sonchifolius]|uniref:Uncharacterized protein n=1 Tax=Smallanthus sonchifolius TaxID=185202 RepID=A0ACB9CC84_9ASTR|nr:hypothetical protein L1987_63068 [Smallanthus sonchifolius]
MSRLNCMLLKVLRGGNMGVHLQYDDRRRTYTNNDKWLEDNTDYQSGYHSVKFSVWDGCLRYRPHFPDWLQTQTKLQRLDLSNSSIRGTIPEWFENILSHILDLDLSNNEIGGKLPQFHGDSSNQIADRILKMNSNKFEGSLATFTSNVNLLDLSDNLLSGQVPQTNGTMNPSLEVVNLSKNRFTGSIPIHVLDLSQNKFSGRLPRCLGNLINLTVIVLTNNNITGVVPSSLGSLKDLCSLHFRNNRFEGIIPVSLQNLTNLVTMDLGNNLFTGTIPLWINEKLSNLVFLNLESNKFTGKIPLQLCQLNSLQYLSLAHNNITGTIPRCFGKSTGMTITTSMTYSREYYMSYYEENILASMKGNVGLCGPPVSTSCSGNDVTYNHVGDDDGQDDAEGVWFYAGMGTGSVLDSWYYLGVCTLSGVGG